jgi:hypothetical protein
MGLAFLGWWAARRGSCDDANRPARGGTAAASLPATMDEAMRGAQGEAAA